VGITTIALFAMSVSLPAMAVNPSTYTAVSVDAAPRQGETQSLSLAGAAEIPFLRDGFTVTTLPEPASYTESASDGSWASLTMSQLSDQGWALPVLGRISSPFGPRPNKPVDGVGEYHNGTDIAATCGQPVFAATSGVVVESGAQGSYGNWILIDHGAGIQTGYAHNSQNLVSPGQQVDAGEVIALVGTTGASSGCHVHFETRIDGDRIDAEAFMTQRGAPLD
jgi:murein DD-endopeptidase MepM/ murein hydrolase activator NlpD